MRLGEMLMRDGRLKEADLDNVIERQKREGGRIGSLLVTEGLIDAETLTVYLGLELGIPIATGDTFERCKQSAVSLLSPEQAYRFLCIPILIQGQTLIVAVDDPHDMRNLDEINRVTGYRVIPRVAPEIRIHFYLERFYGISLPRRFMRIAEAQPSQANQALPAPPLPGLPPRVQDPTEAPIPAPPLVAISANRNFGRVDEALELDAADLIEELEADEEGTAPLVPPSQVGHEEHAALECEHPAALSGEEAIELISKTKKRGHIADAILGHAAEIFEVATLLLVRDNMAFGWKGFGPGLDSDRIETLLMPLEPPSMFQIALAEEDYKQYRGVPFANALHKHWFRVLRSAKPETSIVVACLIGGRVVNLLYGHTPTHQDLSDEQMLELGRVMSAASNAYVRLISKSKRERAGSNDPV